ncbi:AGAP013215-PA [Anopheles gambiae str. PEST]|uniref:AGAP013215-PA n=2 Tax=gambiae species complex TaxID=44542 RepID=F5HK12_ANOGA|nr:tripartite motif-containing protein 75 [Anopheles gambiae]XP_040224693.1 tripartite motif-containing protein 75-like [Anopheles coluzzii]EGK96623.1 AGAP013215-PA [Anopheles gambiae str. PEST]
MKPNKRLNRSKSIDSTVSTGSSLGSLSSLHKYNLRSKGPPRYVQFSDSECPICLEDYSAPVIVNCGHSFCSVCIQECIKMAGLALCPICKEQLVKSLFIYDTEYTRHIASRKAVQYSSSITVASNTKPTGSSSLQKVARRTVV